jgi:hypothetical protein
VDLRRGGDDDRKTFRCLRRFDGEGWASSFFASRQAISALTSRGNQPMFFRVRQVPAKIIRDSRARRGSICPYKENEPFAVNEGPPFRRRTGRGSTVKSTLAKFN